MVVMDWDLFDILNLEDWAEEDEEYEGDNE